MDKLQLLRGKNYAINDLLYIRQPTLDEIYEFGEQNYFSLVSTITSTPPDVKSLLFDKGVDYEKISEFELFTYLCGGLNSSQTSILFGDNVDFSKLKVCVNNENEEIVLVESNDGLVNTDGLIIDNHIYTIMTDYIREMHGYKKNVEKAGNEYTKQILIDEDRELRKQNENKEFSSILHPMIFAMCNCPEFKYDFESVWKLPISIFLTSANKIQNYKNIQYTMQGIYAGNIDTTKLNKDDLKWI